MPFRLTNIWSEVVIIHVDGRSCGVAPSKFMDVEKLDLVMESLRRTQRITVEEVTKEQIAKEQEKLALVAAQRDLLHQKRKVQLGQASKEDLMRRLAPTPVPETPAVLAPTPAPAPEAPAVPESKTARRHREG